MIFLSWGLAKCDQRVPFGWTCYTKIIHKNLFFVMKMKSKGVSTVTLAERFYFFYYLNASRNRSLQTIPKTIVLEKHFKKLKLELFNVSFSRLFESNALNLSDLISMLPLLEQLQSGSLIINETLQYVLQSIHYFYWRINKCIPTV